jgi:hypothetical protein
MKKMTLLFFAIPFISITIAHTQCLEGNCNEGQGTYRYASGAKYVGEFANGKGEGIGICYWKDGSRYDGEWKAGSTSRSGD